MLISLGCFLLSGFIVAWGQPAFFSFLAPFAATIGYALSWFSVRHLSVVKRFFALTFWFFSVQMVSLSWMSSIEFQGYYILVVYVLLALCLGLQYGLFSWAVFYFQRLGFLEIAFLSSIWTLGEWARLWFLCGFSWSPTGLALSAFLPSLQLASIFSIYGLSFLVLLTNLYVYRMLCDKRCWKRVCFLSIFPYLFGCVFFASGQTSPLQHLRVGLIQTGLLPSEKVPIEGKEASFIPPLFQWEAICGYLKKGSWDLIVLPEAALPLQAYHSLYPYERVLTMLESCFGKEVVSALPSLKDPLAKELLVYGKKTWYVSNAFLAQTLATICKADLVIGLDHGEAKGLNYNAAFHFSPFGKDVKRYDKRILMPLGEYLPFKWLKRWTAPYGIVEFFTPGTKAKVFEGAVPLAVSICYEETFPYLVREGCLAGGRLLVNLTNDGYYPDSKLPLQHYLLGRIRAVENGVPLVRACNTGITAVVGSCGEALASLSESKGILTYHLSIESHQTLYRLWGDVGLLTFCSLFILLFFLKRKLLLAEKAPLKVDSYH